MQQPHKVIIHWFRRDLRLDDNAALFHALKQGTPVLPLFIFDTAILDKLDDKADRRVSFIYSALEKLHTKLGAHGSGLIVRHGNVNDILKQLSEEFDIASVFTNHDYEPYARTRDQTVAELLQEKNIPFFTFKDQVIFEKDEVVKDDGTPYTVFTPYKNKWRGRLNDFFLKHYPTEKYARNFYRHREELMPFSRLGFERTEENFPAAVVRDELLHHYSSRRDIPALAGTSRLGLHLRFGTVSVRKLVGHALPLSETWVNELIWREFFMQILWHFPHVAEKPFRAGYERIRWRNDPQEFALWCEGKTGFPLVDAGMRELNATGFMHNRVRMVTAGFLCKHLLIDWRWGEAYFASRLLDFDLAANNGNWQWAAGTGTDAAPYFRIFNPAEQLKKFDPQLEYVRKWVPEYGTAAYPQPIVDHKEARERCLRVYKAAVAP
jgi:deoxyribodipyrimidine photo-lyase